MIDCGPLDDDEEFDDDVGGVAVLLAFEFDVDAFEEEDDDDGGVEDSFDEFDDDDDVDDEDDDDAAPVLLVPVVSIISTLVSFKVCCYSCCVMIAFLFSVVCFCVANR